MSITHIAAEHVVLSGQYLRQRCAWCGDVLVEHDLTRVAVPIGTDPTPATWPAGALVRVDGNLSIVADSIADESGSAELPLDACARNPLTLPGF